MSEPAHILAALAAARARLTALGEQVRRTNDPEARDLLASTHYEIAALETELTNHHRAGAPARGPLEQHEASP